MYDMLINKNSKFLFYNFISVEEAHQYNMKYIP